MKQKAQPFMRAGSYLFIALFFLLLPACKKDKPLDGPNDLGGETNLPLTAVGSVSDIDLDIAGFSSVSGTITVQSNVNGVVTYKVIVDLTGNPSAALIRTLVPADLFDAQGNINTETTFKITSEGIQDYNWGRTPWTAVKFGDEVGAEYPKELSSGETLMRKVVEKTGIDEWPLVFWYVKTSKVEQVFPSNDQYIEKLSYRANHKFGLLYIEAKLKIGTTVKMNITPWHML